MGHVQVFTPHLLQKWVYHILGPAQQECWVRKSGVAERTLFLDPHVGPWAKQLSFSELSSAELVLISQLEMM